MLLDETAGRMAEKGIGFEVTRAMMDKLTTEGYDRMYGARPLRRTIMRLVEDYLADEMLKGELEEGDSVVMDVENGDVVCRKVTDLPADLVKEGEEKKEERKNYL